MRECYFRKSVLLYSYLTDSCIFYIWCGNWNVELISNMLVPSHIYNEMCVAVMFDSKQIFGFYPRPFLAFGYGRCLRLSVCPSVRVCGNHLLVRTITQHPFELGSPNLDQRCKRPWLRSLLFWGAIDLDLQGQIKLQTQNWPILSLSKPLLTTYSS